MITETKIKYFGSKITDLIKGKNLSRQETKMLFIDILLNKQPEIQQGAFLAALAAKGEIAEEIAGAWEAIYELDTVKIELETNEPILENCGTGMDELKTFNISTASAIVGASGGLYIAKHGARAITSKCGTIDILEKLGIDVECDINIIKKSIEECGIGIFNGMSPKIHPTALFRILSKIRFGTILNISASLANPVLPKYALRGVYSENLVELVAKVMREIGYKKAMVVCGLDTNNKSMDELSTLGKTIICELKETGKIEKYTIEPEDVGLKRAKYELLCPNENIEEEVKQFLKIISGKEKGPKYDIVCLNTAPLFYIMGKVKNLQDGIEKARELIETGKAIEKLQQWVVKQNRNYCKNIEKCLVK